MKSKKQKSPTEYAKPGFILYMHAFIIAVWNEKNPGFRNK